MKGRAGEEGAKRCVFCHARPPDTYEDAWPKWLSKALREEFPTKAPFDNTLSRGSILTPELLRGWKGAHRVGGFCRSCNNGWMSNMENEAKDLLWPVVMGKRVTLGRQDQKRLARWAYMKSLVLTLALPEKDLLPATEYQTFFVRKKPPHLAGVVLMTSNQFFLGGLHRFDPIHIENLDGTTTQNYRSTILIGHAVIQVFGARRQTRTPVLPNIRKTEFASRVWPPLREGVEWPLPGMDPEVVEKLLDFFFDKRVG